MVADIFLLLFFGKLKLCISCEWSAVHLLHVIGLRINSNWQLSDMDAVPFKVFSRKIKKKKLKHIVDYSLGWRFKG